MYMTFKFAQNIIHSYIIIYLNSPQSNKQYYKQNLFKLLKIIALKTKKLLMR